MWNLIKTQRPDIDKKILYVKNPFEWMYQFLIYRRKKVGIKKELKVDNRSLIIHK